MYQQGAGVKLAKDDDFQVRPGRIRSKGGARKKRFVAQVLAAAERAGGLSSRSRPGVGKGPSTFGRGRAATLSANRSLTNRSRGAVIKARVVRNAMRAGSLAGHLAYLRREGVSREGEAGRMFDGTSDDADHRAFAERCADDRHHFRFIVSPDDAVELGDLKTFARDLMVEVERDLGTKLDWLGVDHWNTEHPHIHILMRGRAEDGENLVISRDYISKGMRARAQQILDLELGPRTDRDIRRSIERQVDSERWTQLDRTLARQASMEGGMVDLRLDPKHDPPDEFHALKVGRMRKLQRLGLARPAGPSQWTIADRAETTLRELGQRGDIIKRIHRGLTESGIERGRGSFVLAGEAMTDPVMGRLISRGLDDELSGSPFAVIDGADGRTHHVRLPNLEAAGDSAPGSIVELRRYEDRSGRARIALAVRSDLPLEAQVNADGATWLDRQLAGNRSAAISAGGFGAEVREALEQRADHLVQKGLAGRQGSRLVLASNLIETLRRRELDSTANTLASETGLPFVQPDAGEQVSGIYRCRLTLASGRFAMIDDGLGFQLVPWSPSIEQHLGRQISGIAKAGGGVDWSFGRKRGLGL